MPGFSKLISLALASTFLVHAQAGPALPSDWMAMRSVPQRSRLIVNLTTGERMKCRFFRISPTALTVLKNGRTENLDASAISRVYRVVRGRRIKPLLLGAAVGGGIGMGIAGYLYSLGDFVKGVFPLFGLVGAGVGILIGKLASLNGRPVLIYAAHPVK